MRRLRRSLGPIAATWLLCQVATLGLATAVFGFDAVAVTLIECTCAHGTGHTDCPMHHKSGPSRPGLCQMQGAGETDAAILGSLLGQAGVVPAPANALSSTLGRAVVLVNVTTYVLRPAPPDPPPPRA